MNKVMMCGVKAVVFTGLCFLVSPSFSAQTCDAKMKGGHKDSHFQVNVALGTVQDLKSKLVWLRCVEGTKSAGKACVGSPQKLSFSQANNRLKGFNQDSKHNMGVKNWRLPTHEELLSLVDGHCENPAVNLEVFPSTPAGLHWSSSSDSYLYSWMVDFNDGFDLIKHNETRGYVRFVHSIN